MHTRQAGAKGGEEELERGGEQREHRDFQKAAARARCPVVSPHLCRLHCQPPTYNQCTISCSSRSSTLESKDVSTVLTGLLGSIIRGAHRDVEAVEGSAENTPEATKDGDRQAFPQAAAEVEAGHSDEAT